MGVVGILRGRRRGVVGVRSDGLTICLVCLGDGCRACLDTGLVPEVAKESKQTGQQSLVGDSEITRDESRSKLKNSPRLLDRKKRKS